MRNAVFRWVLATGSGFAVGFAVACVSDSTPSAAENDAGGATDAPLAESGAGDDGSAPTGDGSEPHDAGRCAVTGALFCDDFEDDGGPVLAAWDSLSGASVASPGSGGSQFYARLYLAGADGGSHGYRVDATSRVTELSREHSSTVRAPCGQPRGAV